MTLPRVSMAESLWLWAGLGGYTAGTVVAWHGAWTRRPHDRLVLAFLWVGVLALAFAIAERWLQVGYGPFLTMFEILLSNLFSLGLIVSLVFWWLPVARPAALLALLVLLVLGIWMLTVSATPGRLPATYDNAWLWVHVGLGKLFLGPCLVAAGLAGLLLVREYMPTSVWLEALPDTGILDVVAWRFMAVAFVFQGLMLVAGAVWAQDAWGRYWAWDPLETWAFITWLTLAMSLHTRLTWRLPPWVGWWLIIVVFVLAFLTFFGVPFISLAPHKGAV